MRTSIGILDDGAYEVSAYRTDGTGYGQWTPLRAFASQGDAREFAERDVPGERRIPRFEGWYGFPTQPPVCRGDDGLPFGVADLSIPFGRWRREAIKALGNAWVPEVAYEIFRIIQLVEDGHDYD